VLLLRGDGQFAWLDPLEGLDEEVRLQVQGVLRDGITALQVPF
jgi:hypothetical protein